MAKRKAGLENETGLPDLPVGHLELKGKFMPGSMPRELDYVQLIDYVHYLHKLIGIEGDDSEHQPALGAGLVLNDHGVLSVEGASPVRVIDSNAAWIKNMRLRLGATHMGIVEACVVFLTSETVDGAKFTVAHGISRGMFMFPATDKDKDNIRLFTFDGHIPIYPEGDDPGEALFECDAFRFSYRAELAAGKVLKCVLKLGAVSYPITYDVTVEEIVS